MRTITIDIINDKVLNLLRDLELLKLIRFRKDSTQQTTVTNWLNYKGTMSKQPLDIIDRQINDLRNGWE